MTDWKARLHEALPSTAADPAREAEIVEELAQHLSDREAAALAGGASADQAATRAWREVEDERRLARAIRRVDRSDPAPAPPPIDGRGGLLAGLAQDARYAVRLLGRTPGFTLAVVLTLALGIGATTTVVSLVDAVLLRPLPYPDSARLVGVFHARLTRLARASTPASLADYYAVPPAVFVDYETYSTAFDAMGAFTLDEITLAGQSEPEQVRGALVTSGVFKALGIAPLLGQALTPADDRIGAPSRVVLSHALWQRRYGGDPGIIGRQVVADGRPHVVAAVMPAGFGFPNGGEELWATIPDEERGSSDRGSGFLQIVARLKPHMTMDEARRSLEALSRRLAEQHPEDKEFGVRVLPRLDLVSAGVRPILLLMTGAVGAVLLLACTNIANLLLVRAAERRREFGVRRALGAPGRRLVSQVLAESLLLSGAGGAIGGLVAAVGLRPLVAGMPFELPRGHEVGVDLRVLGVGLALTVAVGLLNGLLPALRTARRPAFDALRDVGRGFTGSVRRDRIQSTLVVLQVALAFLLLTSAGLFVRSFDKLTRVGLGFDVDGVLQVDVALPPGMPTTDERAVPFFQEMADRLAAIPGIRIVGAATQGPLDGYSTPPCSVETAAGLEQANMFLATITPTYFQAMGMPIVRGRALAEGDRASGPPVAIVNEALVGRFWSGVDPIGRRVRVDVGDPSDWRWLTVVGVVRNVRQSPVGGPIPAVYVSQAQDPVPSTTFVMRTAVAPSRLTRQVISAVRGMNPDQVVQPRIMAERLRQSRAYGRNRFSIALLGALGLAASLLTVIGIYGVLASVVAQRTHEIGVRVALGASRGAILRRVAGLGLALCGAGLLVGLGAAMAVTRTLRSLLFEVSPTDAVTFALVAALVAAAAAAASVVPARRATRIDPWRALRCE